MPNTKHTLPQESTAGVAVIAGQRQRPSASLGQRARAIHEATKRHGKGLRINRRSAIQRNGIGQIQITNHSAQRGVGLHGQRARAERVVVANTNYTLLQ